ncbi:hypothetical protein VI26_13820 [Chromobacterium sp. LK1]|uniref:hypothetical protein n=1 Tax=Chromobacterium sp. LK1 TaxID=1628193 RepID=UPI000652A12D|nr:hypothetical protein [Chromobacterium sp. LK1]KMN34991.1 hypothetical protein VI26_13820 [Chromobacterium sp. LK1]
MKTLSALLLAWPLLALAAPGAGFSSATEDETESWSRVEPALAEAIVAHEEMREQVDELIKEHGLKQDYRQFFVARPIRLSRQHNGYWFVRPGSAPYYPAFYGAHAFMHWITQGERVIYAGSSDAFSILPGSSHGLFDIEEAQCRVDRCYLVRLRYDGRRYVEAECTLRDLSSGKSGPCQ